MHMVVRTIVDRATLLLLSTKKKKRPGFSLFLHQSKCFLVILLHYFKSSQCINSKYLLLGFGYIGKKEKQRKDKNLENGTVQQNRTIYIRVCIYIYMCVYMYV